MAIRIAAGSATDVGRVREGNEDSFVLDDRLALFAVADGMGGHRGGEVASATAIEALRAAVAAGRPINEAISAANDAVLEKAAGDEELAGMGTTLTAVVVAGGAQILVGHVGDSRAYLLRDGDIERLTEDHSLVEELVREGRLTPEQAEVHPQRAIVTRALGVEPDIDIDIYAIDVRAGDRVILCSDGLTTMVREREVERVARNEPDPQRASENLVDLANAAGGEDNVTVVIIDVLEVDAPAAPDPEALAAPLPPVTPTSVMAPDAPPSDAPAVARRRPLRSVAFVVLPLVLVTSLAIGAVGWYARRSFYVGLDGQTVVLYRGIPGGVLGWDPTVEQRTSIQRNDLSPVDLDDVIGGAGQGSRERAERYLDGLLARSSPSTTSTTSTTSTSTTSPTTTSSSTRP